MVKKEALELLEHVEFVEPCEDAKAYIDSIGQQRTVNLDKIKNHPGKCAWCKGDLPKRRRRWCSDSCVRCAWDTAYPQTPSSKMFRLIHFQNCACTYCGLSYEETIEDKIQKEYALNLKYHPDRLKVSYHQLGSNTGNIWHVDHIIPIFKGGKGICPKNLQVICVSCHKQKTAKDLAK